jgi:hypothetical protein
MFKVPKPLPNTSKSPPHEPPFKTKIRTPILTKIKLKLTFGKNFHFTLKCNLQITKSKIKSPKTDEQITTSDLRKTTSDLFLTTSKLVLTTFDLVFAHFRHKKRENRCGSPFVLQKYNIFRRNPNRGKTSF